MSGAGVLDGVALERLRRLGGETLLTRVITSYLENGPERLAGLLDGAAAGDAARVERAAHTLKSSAGNIGAMRLEEACALLEEQAHTGVAGSDMVLRVRQEYERTVAELSRIVEETKS